MEYLILGLLIVFFSGAILGLSERLEKETLKIFLHLEGIKNNPNIMPDTLKITKQDVSNFLDILFLIKIFLMFVGGSVGANMITHAITMDRDMAIEASISSENHVNLSRIHFIREFFSRYRPILLVIILYVVLISLPFFLLIILKKLTWLTNGST
ncbi:hypothetical protein [Desulfonauticus submarinus]|uniref:hypothetical protein n=1 Tax=Desulfonauticus submarinus TaxID=206665 RepID=UPI00117775C4|nr:hypothetical protein [Desulfonauticus submarinus]